MYRHTQVGYLTLIVILVAALGIVASLPDDVRPVTLGVAGLGDSGGPDYLGSSNVIAGVTSFGINGNCAGTGGVFRLDRQDVLNFVGQVLN